MILFCLMGLNLKKITFTSLLLLSGIYLISLFELIGLVTPVMGAMVRYKSQALPFLMFVLIAITDFKLLATRLPVIANWLNRISK
jgi:hypothetical protein